MKAQPGHLAHAGLNLKQTDRVRNELSKATTAHYALKKIKPVLGWQSQSEWGAGYKAGLAGEPEPKNEKGRSFFGGWLAGKADRDDE